MQPASYVVSPFLIVFYFLKSFFFVRVLNLRALELWYFTS